MSVVVLVIGMVVGALLLAAMILHLAPRMMVAERPAPDGVDATVERLAANAKDNHWNVPKVYDMRQSLLADGMPDVGPIKLVKLCQPEYAARLLGKDKYKQVSVMMPCTVAVYEKSDGRAYAATLRLGLMGRLFGREVAEVMNRVEREDEQMLAFTNR